MKKSLLAATLLAAGATITVVSQAEAQGGPSPLQGQLIAPPGATPGANNNNNSFGTARPGASAVPTPGNIVIHLNARVTIQYYQGWNSLMNAVPGFQTTSNQMSSWARLYPGVDGMAANGLRYGAAIELRTNFGGAITPNLGNAPASGASAYSQTQTIYLRRAFAYLGTNDIGIVRVGEGDGVITLFDGGRTTMQGITPTASFNGSDLGAAIGGNSAAPWAFLSATGDEYDAQNIVYLSPSFAGFDFGLQYTPSAFNALAGCAVPASTCANLITSGTAADGARFKDMYQAGVRYNGALGPVSILAYGAYVGSGHVNFSGTPAQARTQVGAPAGSSWNGQFENLSVGSMGAALTYAGFTVAGNYVTGAINGRWSLKPSGGANTNAWITGLIYRTGPLTVGTAFQMVNSQGAVAMTGLTQRQEYAVDVGVSYALAPGIVIWSDFIYQYRKQSGWNFATNAANGVGAGGTAGTNNSVQGRGFVVGTQVTW